MREGWREHYSLRLLNLAARAGQLVCGQDRVLQALQRNFRGQILLARDAGANLCRKLQNKAADRPHTEVLLTTFSRSELGASQQHHEVTVVAVVAGQFADTIRRALIEEDALLKIDNMRP